MKKIPWNKNKSGYNCTSAPRRKINPELFKKFVLEGYHSKQLAETFGVKSTITIKQYCKFKFPELLNTLVKNNQVAKRECPKKLRNRVSRLKGKTYEEILGVDRAQIRKQQTSSWMKRNNIIWKPNAINKMLVTKKRVNKISTSKEQERFYDIVKLYYPDAISNFVYKVGSRSYVLDIFLPEQRIALEYLGCYWHGCPRCFKNISEMKMRWENTIKRASDFKILTDIVVLLVWSCDVKTIHKAEWFVKTFVPICMEKKWQTYQI
jgi:hypothetical protein